MKDAKPEEVFQFEFDPKMSRVAKLEKIGSSSDKKYMVLPEWYKTWVSSQKSKI